jgi:hypothetical protein
VSASSHGEQEGDDDDGDEQGERERELRRKGEADLVKVDETVVASGEDSHAEDPTCRARERRGEER